MGTFKILMVGVATLWLGFNAFSSQGIAEDALLDTSELRPLTDRGVFSNVGESSETLHGAVEKQLPRLDAVTSTSKKPLVLTGQVQTLQQAIESERDWVDWYSWYLACREYLARTGGLQCPLGTPIKFYRNGHVEAMSFDPACQESVQGRHFPLPSKTRLDALILPVRQGTAPPATPQELYNRIRSGPFR
jgi:hypothetical protein